MAIGKANKATMMTEGVIWKQLIAFAVPLLLVLLLPFFNLLPKKQKAALGL